METMVVVLLARRARAAGLDPARDPIPGLRRDVLFTCSADEEAGGVDGAQWLAANRPDTLRAAGALNEAGGVSMDLAGRRFYPIQVAEKGFETYRITVHGTWGHGSMPRDDNAAVMAAEAIRRLAVPGEPRVTPVMRRLLDELAASLPPDAAALARGDRRRRPAPQRGRHARALRRDVRAGPAGADPRQHQPGRHPQRLQVQRHPGRRHDRDRLPHAPRHDRGRHARGGHGPPGRPRAALHGGAPDRRPAGGGARERRAVRHPRPRRSAPTIRTASRSR